MPSERSASALRHIKTYLRSTMSQARLNHLLLLHTHKDWTDGLQLVSCLQEFIDCKEHRSDVFDKFWLIHYSSINLLCSFIGGVFTTTYWSAYIVWIVHIPSLSIYCILCVNQQLILHELSKWGKVYQYCKLSIAIRAHKKSGLKFVWLLRSQTFSSWPDPFLKACCGPENSHLPLQGTKRLGCLAKISVKGTTHYTCIQNNRGRERENELTETGTT